MKFLKVLIFLLVLFGACRARATITFNTSTVGSSNQASPATVTITAAQGDLLVACFTYQSALTAISGSDAQGSYTSAVTSKFDAGVTDRDTVQFYLPNANSGSHTLSVSWTGAATFTNLNIMAFSGVMTSTPNDTTGNNTGNNTTTVGNNSIGILSTQVQTQEVFVGCARSQNAGADTLSVGSNMTAFIGGGVGGDGMEYRIVSTDLHPFTAQITSTCNGCGYSGSIASYKAAPAGSRFVRLDNPVWELDGGRWAITDRERKRV